MSNVADPELIASHLRLKRSGSGSSWTGDCPCCNYKGGFSLTHRRGALPGVFCHAGGCDYLDIAAALHRLGLWPEPRAEDAPEPPDTSAAAMRIWRRGVAAGGTIVETYIREARGIPWPLPPTLRFAWGRYEGGPWLPMMVAPMFDHAGRLVAVHRTFLAPDGRGKADVPKPKMTLGATRGTIIPLAAQPGPEIVIGEGIENALTLGGLLSLPASAAGAAGNLLHAPLPPIVERVVIAADRDPHGLGERKASAAADRWTRQGRRVRVMLPPLPYSDWNDFLRGRRSDV